MSAKACRHFPKYKAKRQPRCGCDACWDLWFITQTSKTFTAVLALKQLGPNAVRKVQGDVYLKQLNRFLKTEQGKKLNGI